LQCVDLESVTGEGGDVDQSSREFKAGVNIPLDDGGVELGESVGRYWDVFNRRSNALHTRDLPFGALGGDDFEELVEVLKSLWKSSGGVLTLGSSVVINRKTVARSGESRNVSATWRRTLKSCRAPLGLFGKAGGAAKQRRASVPMYLARSPGE
jgi:hypothetical protein